LRKDSFKTPDVGEFDIMKNIISTVEASYSPQSRLHTSGRHITRR